MELFTKILESNGISHNKFAKDLGISKSYIIPMINGEKNITLNIYNRMIKLPYIEPYRAEISELYFRQRIGNEKFSLIQIFLDEADKFSKADGKAVCESPPPVNPDDYNSDRQLTKEETVSVAAHFLRKAIASGEEFLTNYSYSCEDLDNALFAVANESGLYSENTVNHITFYSGELDKNAIITYWNALKWAPMKVITKVTTANNTVFPMPFYVISEESMLIFDTECNGFVINSREIAKKFSDFHRQITATPIVYLVHDETELLTGCAIFGGNTMRSFDSALCPIGKYDYDMLMRATNKAIPHQILDILIKAYLNYYDMNSKYNELTSYVKYESVTDWLKNGREYSVTKKYLNSFPMEDRKKAIERVSDAPHFRLLKEGRLNIPQGYGFDAFDTNLQTHSILINDDARDYEVYCKFDYAQIKGLENFVNNMFDFIALEYNCYPVEKGREVLKQLAILGDII